jgi:hypothetical protein
MAAIRELLARSQPFLEERIASLDSQAVTTRYDGGQWECILVRHEHWRSSIGLALEWNRSVDPQGANSPKVGVFWWADPPTLIAPRTQLVILVPKRSSKPSATRSPLSACGLWVRASRRSRTGGTTPKDGSTGSSRIWRARGHSWRPPLTMP